MSVDHSVVPFTRSEERSQPVFLSVKAGMTVICGDSNSDDWWMADVIHVDGGARDPKVPTLFQVVDVDTRLVRWVCADLSPTSFLAAECRGKRAGLLRRAKRGLSRIKALKR